MHRLAVLAASVIVLGLASGPAMAYCARVPDGPSTGNVANGAALAACLQSELAAQAEAVRQASEFRALVQDVQMQQVQQRLAPATAPGF